MDETRITTLEALRAIIPEPNPLGRAKVLDHLDGQALKFLDEARFLLIATASPEGRIEVSPKGDEPGFIRVEDARTIVIPERAGNNLAFGLTNLVSHPQVGVIVLRPGTGETLRFSGSAEILADPPLLQTLAARGRPALLAVRIRIERVFFHCARSVLRAGLWASETWPDPQKVSFGRIYREQARIAPATVELIDRNVDLAYEKGL